MGARDHPLSDALVDDGLPVSLEASLRAQIDGVGESRHAVVGEIDAGDVISENVDPIHGSVKST
jgi:hypothetical protein